MIFSGTIPPETVPVDDVGSGTFVCYLSYMYTVFGKFLIVAVDK
jgi:hypothetical protein